MNLYQRSIVFLVFQTPCLVSCMGSDSDSQAPQTSSSVAYDAFFVVNGESNSISVIDAEEGSNKKTISLSGVSYPHHVNLSPDGNMLMVSAPGMDLSGGHGSVHGEMKGSLLMLDAKTGDVMISRTMDGMSHNAAFSPDGKEVWASLMMMPGELLVLDASTLATKQTIEVGDMPAEVTFSSDGKYGFVANGMSNSVTVIDASSKEVIKQIAVGQDPVGAWTGSDNVMYVDNEDGKSISAIDASTLTVIRTYDLGFTPGMASLAPSGELWVSDSDNGKVIYFMKNSTMKMGEVKVGAGAHAIAFTEDGTMGYVTNQGDETVSMIDTSTHLVMKTITVGRKPNGIIFRKN